MRLLPEVLAPFQPQIAPSYDDVVVTIDKSKLLQVARMLKEDNRVSFDLLRLLTVVDYKDRFEVVYHLWSLSKKHRMVLKVNTSADEASVPSLFSVWRTVDWYEREARDLYGVNFEGHPNLTPLLLWEGFEGYPGRKSYPMPEYKEY